MSDTMNYGITIQTSKKIDFVDITDKIDKIVVKSKVTNGLCIIFVKHTTAAVIIGEAEFDLISDMEKLVKMIPELGFSHEHSDPGHTPAHILSSLIGQSVTIPVIDGQLDLGTWQRVMFVELHGPRDREFSISVIS